MDNAIYQGESDWIESLTISGEQRETVQNGLYDIPDIEVVKFQSISSKSETHHLIAFVQEQNPFILSALAENNAIPYRLVAEGNRLTVVVVIEDWNHLKELAADLETGFEAFELISTAPTEQLGSLLGTDSLRRIFRDQLTENQLDLLETAYRMGYFEVPKDVNSEAVADELGISQPAFSEQFRRAEYKIFSVVFGDIPE